MAMFGLGFASGTVFHEFGHASAAWATGAEVLEFNFQSVKYRYPKEAQNTNSKIQFVSLSGYGVHTLATELIIRNKKWHENDFALGWMSLGILVNISNPIRYYIFGQKRNDLGFYEKAGGDPLYPAVFMVTYSLFSIYRIMVDTDIPVHINNNTIGLNLKF